MTLIAADRVVETSATTGTGALALGGAIVGYKPFSSAMSVGDTCYYVIEAVDVTGVPTGDYELGIGTYSAADTLTRTTVQKSSNANAAVVLAAGTKRVFIAATQAYLATLGGGGALVLLEQHTAAGSASLDFTAISSVYDEYLFEMVNVLNATQSAIPYIRMSTDGGATFDSGGNYNDYYHSRSGLTFSANGSVTDTRIQMNNNGHVNTFNHGINGQFRLFSPLSTALHKMVTGSFVACDGGASGSVSDCQFSGRYMSLTAVNALRFLFSSGNITSGTIRMYGIAK